MGFQIEDGLGSGKQVGVADDNRLNVTAKTMDRIYYCSRDMGDAFSIIATDSAPATGEVTLWIQNNSATQFVVHRVMTSSVSADAVFKMWNTTGQTGAGADVITPQALNLASSLIASLTVRGGITTSGGVTGLTATASQTKMLRYWANGPAYNTHTLDFTDTLRIGQNQSIGIEYDAGSLGAISIVVLGYFDEY